MPSTSSIRAGFTIASIVCCVTVLHACIIGWLLARHNIQQLAFPQTAAAQGAVLDQNIFHITLRANARQTVTATPLQVKQTNKRSTSSANHAQSSLPNVFTSPNLSPRSKKYDFPNATSAKVSAHASSFSPSASLLKNAPATHHLPSPLICHAPPPHYPARARRQGEQGTALIRLTLNSMGQVKDVVLQRSSGFATLDQAALTAASQAICSIATGSMPMYTYLRFQFDLLD